MNNIIPIKKGNYIPDIEIKGRTLVNLLGRRGNAVYKNWFSESIDHVWGTLTYDNDTFVVEKTDGDRIVNMHTLNVQNLIEVGKCYIALADVKPTEVSDTIKGVSISGATVGQKSKPNHEIGKFNTVYVAWKASNNTYFEIVGLGKMYVKNIRLYEIDESVLQKINVEPEYSWDNLIKKYPYVDDIKCVMNPYLESKENLLDGAYWFRGNNYDFSGLYDAESADSLFILSKPCRVVNGKEYSVALPRELKTLEPHIVFYNGSSETNFKITDMSQTFTSNGNVCRIVCKNINDVKTDVEVEYLKKVTLCEGSESKKYEECHNSRIMFETKLYDGETLSRRNDGTYVKNSEWEERHLSDFDFMTSSTIPNGEFHSVVINRGSVFDDEQVAMLVRYDGKILINKRDGLNSYEHFYVDEEKHPNQNILIVIPNELSGWGIDYIPTREEVKAFFLGWRMYKRGASGTMLYDGNESTGAKAWVKLYCGVGTKATGANLGVDFIDGSNKIDGICPTVMNDQGYKPYRIIYKKETPTVEEVKTHGSLLVREGVDVKVSSGLVLGDKVEEFIANGKNYVAGTNTKCNVSNRVRDVLKVFDVDGNIMQHINIGRATAEGCIVGGNNQATYTSIINDDLADYLIYGADTVTLFDYSFNKPDSVKESISRSQQEVTNCFEELARTKKELERAKEELAQRSNPNLLINGDLQVWQRGTKFTNIEGTKYTADRWQVYKSAAGTAIPNVVKTDKGIKVYASQIATGMLYLVQTIECPKNLWGRKITISYKGDQVYSNINFNSNVVSGSTGADLGQALYPSNDKNKQFTTVVPIGTKAISVLLFVDTSVKTSFEIEWVKAEVGEYTTPLSPRQYAEEFDLCQRYYQYTDVAIYSGSSVVGQRVGMTIPLQHKMRTTPSITNLSVDAVGIDTTNYNLTVTSDRIHIASSTTTVNSSNRINFAMYLDAEIY